MPQGHSSRAVLPEFPGKHANFENRIQICYFVFTAILQKLHLTRIMSALQEKIIQDLLDREGIQLTMDQEKALSEFFAFHQHRLHRSAYLLRGAAGTGKTFMIRLLTWSLLRQGYKVALLAPTGRAAKVITRRTRRYASTVHRHIYSPEESPGGSIFFRLKENEDAIRMYYIVDEASMVGDGDEGSTGLLADLLKFVYTEHPERKIIVVGDPAQLPPVGSSLSPALDPAYLKDQYGIHCHVAEMTEVMRQGEASEVLVWANQVREAMEMGTIPAPELNYGGEVELLENGYEALELYTGLYNEDDPDNVIFITYSNKLAVEVNRAIRQQMFEPTQELIVGEMLMVVRNNYAWGNKDFPFIANGEMGMVKATYPETYEELHGLRFMDVDLEFLNLSSEPVELRCKLILNLLDTPQAQVSYRDMQELIRTRRIAYESLPKTRAHEAQRKDPYMNALQVKYGYAVTGHKAQGGQWRNVIVGFEPQYQGMELNDYLRWSYTAMTRAEERLYLLNCPFVQREW